MINRGDHDAAIISRLHTDEEFDWKSRLIKAIWMYPNSKVKMKIIDANANEDVVFAQVMSHIKSNTIMEDVNVISH